MARTAPVPNIPPIPGMCPSIAVMGGGGGAGGGSGGSGGSGSADAGAGGNGNGNDANGDGSSAGSCGQGSQGRCPNHGQGTTAGDPVDVATGRVFTVPVVDLLLPGVLPLRFARAYSSFARRRDVGLGHGWSHSYAWEARLGRAGLRLFKPDGTHLDFPPFERHEEQIATGSVRVRRQADGFVVATDDFEFHVLRPSSEDPDRFLSSEVYDLNGNRVLLEYERDQLVALVDSVGRRVRLARDPSGRLVRLDVFDPSVGGWVTFATYRIDEHGDLTSVEDADGHVTRFSYEDHRLVEQVHPTGLRFHWIYDADGRCVETWGDYASGTDPALDPSVPAMLADGVTRARGILHCRIEYSPDGYRELVDSRRVDRFEIDARGRVGKAVTGGAVTTRTYDRWGNELTKCDANGATWTYERDDVGRITAVTDPMGARMVVRRDERGLVEEVIDSKLGSTRYARDARGNILSRTDPDGGVHGYRYDPAGRVVEVHTPTGRKIGYRFDELGNLREARQADGSTHRFEFDHFGRCTASVAPNGARTSYAWSRGSRKLGQVDPLGASWSYEYDGLGHLVRETRPDGTSFRYHWAGLHRLYAIERPDGTSVRATYDREGNLLRLRNGAGEECLFEYSLKGFLSRETLWDGRSSEYTYDAVGNVLTTRSASGARLEIQRDALGRIVGKRWSDGTVVELELDVQGLVVAASKGNVKVRFERDALGGIVKEVQTIGDESVDVHSSYDADGRRVGRTTSTGHALRLHKNARGYLERADLDGHELSWLVDSMGRETRADLGRGGSIETRWDVAGRLLERTIGGAGTPQADGGRPDWIGAPAGSIHTYGYDVVGRLVDATRGAVGRAYRYDAVDQLIELVDSHAPGRKIAYDQARNALDGGASYARGNLLEVDQRFSYEWDADGRMIERRTRDGASRWRFEWLDDGCLRAVVGPDGARTEFLYDAFGRRLLKRHLRRGLAGLELHHETRFVWDRDTLCEESTVYPGGRRERRTYLFRGEDFAPIAHVDHGSPNGELRVYANDPAGTPDLLLDEAGRVVCELDATPWGRSVRAGQTSDTPIRRQGEYFDTETGLVYNRYRYVDPELGRFLSPDPVGLEGGLDLYRSGPNSVGWVDPFGLSPESDRASDIRTNQGGVGWGTTYAVATLSNGDTVVVDSRGAVTPATRVRDPSFNNTRGTPGAAASGGVTDSEWLPRAGPDSNPGNIDNPHHAERRIIEHCRAVSPPPPAPPVTITSISATNNVCPTCRAAIRAHSPGAVITNPDGTAAPNP